MSDDEATVEYLTVTQAREELGVTKPVMARLIREGTLHTEEHPFDKRMKLVRRDEVDALKSRFERIKKALPSAA